MLALGRILFKGLALSLGLDADFFRNKFEEQAFSLESVSYKEHTFDPEADEWGVAEHTDRNFLTILSQDQSGGLEIKRQDGTWLAVPPREDMFVINIGDMLEFWTYGVYKATPHRVRNKASGARQSIPFFMEPNWSATLERIPLDKLDAKAVEANEEYRKNRVWI